MAKKGQQMTLGTIIAIVLGFLVLVFLIYGFSTGWGNMWYRITTLGGGEINSGAVKLACSNACQSKNEYGFCDMKRELVLEKERKTFGRCLDFVGKGLGVEECEICEKKSVGCSTDVGFDHDCDGIPSTGGGSSQITP